MHLAWGKWLYGLAAAVIGGGSGAVVAAVGVNLIDPKDWNVSDHPAHLFTLMGVCFGLNAVIAFFAYLKQDPLPPVETVTTVQNIQPSGPGIKATTVTTTEVQKDKP